MTELDAAYAEHARLLEERAALNAEAALAFSGRVNIDAAEAGRQFMEERKSHAAITVVQEKIRQLGGTLDDDE